MYLNRNVFVPEGVILSPNPGQPSHQKICLLLVGAIFLITVSMNFIVFDIHVLSGYSLGYSNYVYNMSRISMNGQDNSFVTIAESDL
jgi:hypothetical protein